MGTCAETLTAEAAGATITRAFPEFRGRPVELLDEGWDFKVFDVGARWVFRFPKREGAIVKLNKERKLLPGLLESVSLPVPRYEYFRESLGSADRTFGGYGKLPGISGDTSRVVDRHTVARQLGEFLGRLHAYPVDKAREAGVPEEQDLAAFWRNRSLEQLESLVDPSIDRSHLCRYLEDEAPGNFDGAPSLVHNDLWAEHVLVDTRSGGVRGIIDWGDALIGDTAVDFACLCAWYGEGWLEDVLAHYTGRPDPGLIPRAHYLATCRAIHNLTLARDLYRPAWVKAAYEVLQLIHAD